MVFDGDIGVIDDLFADESVNEDLCNHSFGLAIVTVEPPIYEVRPQVEVLNPVEPGMIGGIYASCLGLS